MVDWGPGMLCPLALSGITVRHGDDRLSKAADFMDNSVRNKPLSHGSSLRRHAAALAQRID